MSAWVGSPSQLPDPVADLGRDLGDAEVDQLHLPIPKQHDVAGADVPVNQAQAAPVLVGGGVGVIQGQRDLGGDVGRQGHRQRLLLPADRLDHPGQAQPVQQLHRQVQRAVGDAVIVGADDVRVLQQPHHLDLVREHAARTPARPPARCGWSSPRTGGARPRPARSGVPPCRPRPSPPAPAVPAGDSYPGACRGGRPGADVDRRPVHCWTRA